MLMNILAHMFLFVLSCSMEICLKIPRSRIAESKDIFGFASHCQIPLYHGGMMLFSPTVYKKVFFLLQPYQQDVLSSLAFLSV